MAFRITPLALSCSVGRLGFHPAGNSKPARLEIVVPCCGASSGDVAGEVSTSGTSSARIGYSGFEQRYDVPESDLTLQTAPLGMRILSPTFAFGGRQLSPSEPETASTTASIRPPGMKKNHARASGGEINPTKKIAAAAPVWLSTLRSKIVFIYGFSRIAATNGPFKSGRAHGIPVVGSRKWANQWCCCREPAPTPSRRGSRV